MSPKEQLYYLIDHYINKNTYNTNTFTDEFYRIYNFELERDTLDQRESKLFSELFDIAARYSPYVINDLEEMNIYYSEEEVSDKAREVWEELIVKKE